MQRKRKNNKSLEEEVFEKKPRFIKGHENAQKSRNVKSRHLLPIKIPSGKIVTQTVEVEQNEESVDDVPSAPPTSTKTESTSITKTNLAANRRVQIAKAKNKIAKLASAIVAEPQANIKYVKQLRLMLEDETSPESCATTRKLVVASLACLFIDIIPGYRIRERTEKEKKVKLSKEVKSLTDFEESLLHQYKLFLQYLEKLISKRKRPGKNHLLSAEAEHSLGNIAIQCLCDLYVKTSHFNFHNNISIVIVPIANDDADPTIRKYCCDAIQTLFATDKLGASTFATVKALSNVAKQRGPKKIRPEFLNTLLFLRITKVDYSMVAHKKNKAERKKAKEMKKKMSRRQLKHMKKQKAVENELKEAAATEDIEQKTQLHTETVQQVFLIYFRILKHKSEEMAQCRSVLPVVLEGLAKFSNLINIDFFGDLLVHLQRLVSSGELSIRENLHCIFTAFQILTGQGEVLMIDPASFYQVMFTLLNEIPFNNKLRKSNKEQDQNCASIAIECIEMMLNKRRKQVTIVALKSFIKRLYAITLHLQPSKFPLAMLDEIRKLFNSNSKSVSLFDIESQSIGSYNAELDDPERTGSNSSVIWETHLLRRHYVPLVSQTATRIVKDFAV
uniref:Nucleolar complex protein 3 homolog n=1 Tax=Phallusia mammillata TaxID=59560 RepID=A0A6F9DN15_9ASCI|nr:nucleolar complex protein 3 homolog [Phallusia mammillata]